MICSNITQFTNLSQFLSFFKGETCFIYRRFSFYATFHSYDWIESRERMKRPFFRETERVESISHYANKLARNFNFDPKEWQIIISKSKEKLDEFKPNDIALLLNSLSRARMYDRELFQLLVPQIINKISFFTSVYISMVLSAYSKGKLLSPDLYNIFKNEISNRLYEFRTSTEMCMVMNAISKFEDTDKLFLNKIANHITRSFLHFHFTPQELSVIINSFVTLGYYNEHLFNTFSDYLINNLGLCNIYELIRIFNGFLMFENNFNNIAEYCKDVIVSRVRFCSPEDLTNSLYALGNIKSAMVQSNIELNLNLIDSIVESIKSRSIYRIGSFKMTVISYFLMSFSKWHFKLEKEEFLRILEHTSRIKMDSNLSDFNNTVIAIMKLYCNISGLKDLNEVNSVGNDEMLLEIQKLLQKWSKVVKNLLDEENQDLNVIIRVLDSYNKFGVYDDELFEKVKSIIVVKYLDVLNKNNGYTLYEIYSKHKGHVKYDDFTEILSELIS